MIQELSTHSNGEDGRGRKWVGARDAAAMETTTPVAPSPLPAVAAAK